VHEVCILTLPVHAYTSRSKRADCLLKAKNQYSLCVASTANGMANMPCIVFLLAVAGATKEEDFVWHSTFERLAGNLWLSDCAGYSLHGRSDYERH
jgi:hypothetical protein